MKPVPWRGILWVLLGAVLWSTGGVAVKWLPLPGLFVSAARSAKANELKCHCVVRQPPQQFTLMFGWRRG